MKSIRQTKRTLKFLCIWLCLIFVFISPSIAAKKKKPVKATAQEIAQSGSLEERQKAISEKEKELEQKEQDLLALKKELDEKLTRLIKLQNEIKSKLADLKTIKNKDFNNLVKIYSSMSASKVAPLLNKMEDDEAVEILKAMKAELVAKIIPKLNQDKAVRISKQLGLI